MSADKPVFRIGDEYPEAAAALREHHVNPEHHYRVPAIMVADLIHRAWNNGAEDVVEGLESIYDMLTIEQRAEDLAGWTPQHPPSDNDSMVLGE